MTAEKIYDLIKKSKISSDSLLHHLEQSVALDKIALETHELTDGNTLDLYEKISEGERLIKLIRVTL